MTVTVVPFESAELADEASPPGRSAVLAWRVRVRLAREPAKRAGTAEIAAYSHRKRFGTTGRSD